MEPDITISTVPKVSVNPDVRRALAMAIDRRTICESIVPSKPEPAYGFVPYKDTI